MNIQQLKRIADAFEPIVEAAWYNAKPTYEQVKDARAVLNQLKKEIKGKEAGADYRLRMALEETP